MCGTSGALQPHVCGPGDVNAPEFLHEIDALLPELHQVIRTRRGVRRSPAGELAVDGRNAIFQGGRERRGRTVHHAGGRVDALELLLERRRFPLDRSEICGVCLPGAERPEHEQPRDRRGRRHAPDAPALAPPPPPGQHGVAYDGPAVPRGTPRRQGLELRHALIQRIELRPTRRARFGVRARPGGRLARPQGQQIVHRAMHHGAAPSASSIPRSRACARASCDFEKLTVLPICSAISSCVYPSTSCSHTTAREVSLNRSNARSRSIRAGIAEPPGPPAASSCSSSVARTWLRRMRISALDAAICLIHPHRCPSARYCLMLRTTSRNVSCSTSSASSGLRSMRRARLYTGVSNARYSASSASRSPDFARATRISGTASEMVIS